MKCYFHAVLKSVIKESTDEIKKEINTELNSIKELDTKILISTIIIYEIATLAKVEMEEIKKEAEDNYNEALADPNHKPYIINNYILILITNYFCFLEIDVAHFCN